LSFDKRTFVLGAAVAPPTFTIKALTRTAAPISFRIPSPSQTLALLADGSPLLRIGQAIPLLFTLTSE
jgi:hypothetical protein